MPRPLFPDGYFVFRDGDGEVVEDGEAYYPASLVVEFNRRQAIHILHQIAEFLDSRPNEESTRIAFEGTIERIEQ